MLIAKADHVLRFLLEAYKSGGRRSRAAQKGRLTMKLYLRNAVTTATTLTVLALLGRIGCSVYRRAAITCWGRRSPVLLVFGLVVCCLAAARDGLGKTIQHAVDGSCAPGLFPLLSLPTAAGCIGAPLIIVSAIATPVARSQRTREILFCIPSGGMMLKIVTTELTRNFLHERKDV